MTMTPHPSLRYKRSLMLGVMVALVPLTTAAQPKARANTTPAKALHERGFEDIVRSYTFIGDFSEKPPERRISDEIFWRYPLPLPKVEFPLDEGFDPSSELPVTKGTGRSIEGLNRGRALLLDKKLDEAKATWLTARARFGKEFAYHRRNDYFLGLAFLQLANLEMQAGGKAFSAPEVRATYANAATFFAWAFINKADIQDDFLDQVTPKGLYNLAAIYWRYDRFAGAYGAAEKGLNFLRKTGRKNYRPEFNRIIAESFIKNGSSLEAMQMLDTAIRQDPAPTQAAASFARAGDIYFDLNNYELAEDAYSLGAKIDEDLKQINPAQLVLRGEALFWLGKFSESQKMLHFALKGPSYRKVVAELPPDYASWAALRLADNYLARKELDKAKLEYFRVSHQYPGTFASRIASVRQACLELPFYAGQNIKHARELLEQAKVGEEMPPPAIELAWACQVGSYTDRERTPEMLQRVKAFAVSYPDSRFLQSFVEPVREFQATHLAPLFAAGETYKAIDFFEKTRKMLFSKIPLDIAQKLFAAYADTARSGAAREFWPQHAKLPDSDLKALREVVVAAELVDQTKEKTWQNHNAKLSRDLAKRTWRLPPSRLASSYVMRLMQTKTASKHYAWLQSLAQHWATTNDAYTCDLEYPILSRMADQDKAAVSFVLPRTKVLIDQNLPELFKHDESCALSLLELEARLMRGDSQALAERYIGRREWPLVGGFLHLYWTIAEHINDGGDRPSAEKMWTVVRDKGQPGSPEVEFAKARLDTTRTEFDKLWD